MRYLIGHKNDLQSLFKSTLCKNLFPNFFIDK